MSTWRVYGTDSTQLGWIRRISDRHWKIKWPDGSISSTWLATERLAKLVLSRGQ